MKTDSISIPLKNAVTPQEKHSKVTAWVKGAIGYLYCNSNDLQHSSQQTAIFSSVYNGGNGFYITADNLWQIAIIFSVRKIIKPTWINDRDQFLQPTLPLNDEFKIDCLIWMLFNGSNVSAGANDLLWNNEKWNIVNHFIPYSEDDVNAPERFESNFMVQYLKDKKISSEAKLVLEKGKDLWRAYFAYVDDHKVREELKLNRPDVGWYQIRKALQARNTNSDIAPANFKPFEDAYTALGEKLRPMVYELGFLKL